MHYVEMHNAITHTVPGGKHIVKPRVSQGLATPIISVAIPYSNACLVLQPGGSAVERRQPRGWRLLGVVAQPSRQIDLLQIQNPFLFVR